MLSRNENHFSSREFFMRKNYVLLFLCAISFFNFDCIAMKKDGSGGSVSQYASALARLAQGVLSAMKGPLKEAEEGGGEIVLEEADPAQRKKRLIAGVLGALALTGGPTGYAAYAMSEGADSSDPVTFDNPPALRITSPLRPEHSLPPSHSTHLSQSHWPMIFGSVDHGTGLPCCIDAVVDFDHTHETFQVRLPNKRCTNSIKYEPLIRGAMNISSLMPSLKCDVGIKFFPTLGFIAIKSGKPRLICITNHLLHRPNACTTKEYCRLFLSNKKNVFGRRKECIADPDELEFLNSFFNVTGPIDELNHPEESGD